MELAPKQANAVNACILFFVYLFSLQKGHFTKPLLTSTVLEAVAEFILVCWSSLWRHHFPRMSTNWCVQSIFYIFHICRCVSKQRIDICRHDCDAEEHAHHREKKKSPQAPVGTEQSMTNLPRAHACSGVCVCKCWGIAGDGVGGARRVYTVSGDTCQNHQIHSSDKHSHLDDYSMLQMTAILFVLIRTKLCLSVSHCASLPSFCYQKDPQANCFFHLLSHITPQQSLRTSFFSVLQPVYFEKLPFLTFALLLHGFLTKFAVSKKPFLLCVTSQTQSLLSEQNLEWFGRRWAHR